MKKSFAHINVDVKRKENEEYAFFCFVMKIVLFRENVRKRDRQTMNGKKGVGIHSEPKLMRFVGQIENPKWLIFNPMGATTTTKHSRKMKWLKRPKWLSWWSKQNTFKRHQWNGNGSLTTATTSTKVIILSRAKDQSDMLAKKKFQLVFIMCLQNSKFIDCLLARLLPNSIKKPKKRNLHSSWSNCDQNWTVIG